MQTNNKYSAVYKVTVTGKGGHGASPQSCIDPVLCLSALINEMQLAMSRETVELEFLSFNAGTKFNIIPMTATCDFSLICDKASVEKIENRLRRTCNLVSGAHGAIAELCSK